MSHVLAVYQKELWHYFRSPIAYFIVAVFLVGTGYFFTFNMFVTGLASMTTTFQNMGILLLMVAPLISMRVLSTEYRAGTMELLMTLPLRPWEIVASKFLGVSTILFLMTAGTLIDVVPLYLFGQPDTGAIVSGYVGFALLGMACLAVGILCSAVTENQIVAALLTVCLLLGFWFVGYLAPVARVPWLRVLLGYLSLSNHFGEFVKGLLRTESAAYFLVVSWAALFLSTRALEWRR
jgi:gliding motility-associated transport system permease protein